MHPLLLILHLAAAVMLLLWAVRMVRTGMERAYGAALRDGLRKAQGGVAGMALAGAVLAVLLQSSTAVGLLAAGFAGSGLLGGAAGLAALIGADVGSALVVRILSLDLSGLIPVLILAGCVLFLKFEGRQPRQIGRIILGIGFVLLSLKMIGEATQPLRSSTVLPLVIGYLQNDALTSFALVALLTFGLHSSVAMVLLLATLAGAGVLPVAAALPMVLGANLGAGVIALWLTRDMSPQARRIPLGNLIVRAAAALAGLLLLQAAPANPAWFGASPAAQLVNAHLAFNLVLAGLALPLVTPVTRLAERLLKEKETPDLMVSQRPQSALDRSTLALPGLALASAKRELLLMGETVEQMFRPVMDLMAGTDPERITAVRALDAEVNRRHRDIKLFIAEMTRGQLSEEDARRGLQLTDFAINMEHVGDIIAKTLLPLADEKIRLRLTFSDEGWAEMLRLHARVLANLQMAMNVLVSGDTQSAQQLMREKEAMRQLERDSHERHLKRLQTGNADSIATSNMHLEVVRAFKEINSLLVTVAHPILEEQGLILKSRLAEPGEALRRA
ncbi:Na/Pi cotransporter family protein [Pannonibacter tanglangensis]|uniref:Na/Pi cotransporter family protein n=1 Tax=Pannonibacter tanglangensis TaxID=2750084 RepID=A0ABW9ZPP9_9HYPH|nr:Na/Pi cotransporter family protein [Pannonibacter sp. XCT-34]NBN66058.1 Na/Pi cotransporter family protein [Pannonibacter sp. XCT-34]